MLQSVRAKLPDDFDTWMTLAKNDPAQFEALRMAAIDGIIAQIADDERRMQLRRLQWRIDRIRERAPSPLAACVEISRLMWDSFSHLRECYQDILMGPPRAVSRKPVRRTAQVIPFRSRTESA